MIKKQNKKLNKGGKKQSDLPIWDLSILYPSPDDPAMENDIASFEKAVFEFADKYEKAGAGAASGTASAPDYLSNDDALLEALKEYEELVGKSALKAVLYFYYLQDIDAKNPVAPARLSLYENRLAKVQNSILFFEISLGKMPAERQEQVLQNPKLARYKVYLSRVFDDIKHSLTVPEEKIMNLKSLPSYDMWVMANERILNTKTVIWKKKALPLPSALQLVSELKSAKDRRALARSVSDVLSTVAPFSEAEINAVFTNKKINDELRGYATAYENTVKGYRNDPEAVEKLVATVSSRFDISHRFYKLKGKILGLRKMGYCDRAAKIGFTKSKYAFSDSVEILRQTFGNIDPEFVTMLEEFVKERRVDVPPRIGKRSGAYCSSSFENPTFILLNHTDDLRSFSTLAHEMGHAFHSRLSKAQGPIYSGYSTSLAETASTLFESLAMEAVFEKLSIAEKKIVLHNKINNDIATVFRQIACFNFENDLHKAIREKGYLKHEEIGALHNKNMKAYLGPAFELLPHDGLYFVHWSHIRNFFYVYTYAYGMLVSKALLRRYRHDKSFWPSIRKFLSAGGKDSPENILREIGIDVASPDFWLEGLREIDDDIKKLEKLAKK